MNAIHAVIEHCRSKGVGRGAIGQRGAVAHKRPRTPSYTNFVKFQFFLSKQYFAHWQQLHLKIYLKMSTVRTTTTTTRTTVVTSPGSSTPGHYPQNGSARSGGSTAGRPAGGSHPAGRSGGGRTRSSGGSGCNCGGAGGGGLAAAAHWLALASAIIIIVAWIFRFMVADKKYESAPAWFEFLLFLFLALMVILGGFGIGNLDGFLEEYLQLTISMLGKGVLLILFCCRVYANRWGWFERKDSSSSAVFHTLASLLCCIAASLAILVLLVGLGVAK
eukprot:XP_001707541.1 Hypothetical protein GL50803_88960 [Giardia lamblia ATCC 50803]